MLLHQLWHEADYRVAADGGANQLYNAIILIPDAVVGDFDSLQAGSQEEIAKLEAISC